MVLLPLIRSRVDVPIIAAGGMCDGLSMAGAFAMGAEGVQMGTRMLSCSDSPVHDNWKQAIVDAADQMEIQEAGQTVRKYGIGSFRATCADLMDYSERLMRQAIADLEVRCTRLYQGPSAVMLQRANNFLSERV